MTIEARRILKPRKLLSILSLTLLNMTMLAPVLAADPGAHRAFPDKTFLPADADIDLRRSDDAPDQTRLWTEEDIVWELYAMAANRVSGPDNWLSVHLSDFVTVYRDDFNKTPWHEVSSNPSLRSLAIQPLVRANNYDGETKRSIQYNLEWKDDRAPETPDITVSEALITFTESVLARDRGDFASLSGRTFYEGGGPSRVRALTSFHVQLEALGETTDYRAAVFWELVDGAAVALMQDRVIQGIEQLVFRTAAPEPHGREKEETLSSGRQQDRRARTDDKLYVPGESRTCHESTKTIPYFKELGGFEGHTENGVHYGNHYAALRSQITISCLEDCTIICDARVLEAPCDDVGNLVEYPTYWHNMRSDTSGLIDSDFDGSLVCTAAMACGAYLCTPFCPGGSVSVQIGTNGLATSSISGAFWQTTLKQTLHATCDEIDEDETCD